VQAGGRPQLGGGAAMTELERHLLATDAEWSQP